MKKMTPLLIAAVLFLGIGGFYLFSQKNKGDTTSMTKDTMEEMTDTPSDSNGDQGFVGSIKDALTMGSSMKCTFSYQDVKSTAYIKDDMVYYQSDYQGKTSYVIAKDNCTWTWEGSEGLKICLDESEIVEGEEMEFEEPQTGDVDLGEYEYDCKPAVVADSMFEVPANVEFVNPMEMMPDIPEDFQMPQM